MKVGRGNMTVGRETPSARAVVKAEPFDLLIQEVSATGVEDEHH